jgi:hypothetical protein
MTNRFERIDTYVAQRIAEEAQRRTSQPENTKPKEIGRPIDLQAFKKQRFAELQEQTKRRIRIANPDDPEKWVRWYEHNVAEVVQPLDTLVTKVVNELVENRKWQLNDIQSLDPENEGLNIDPQNSLRWYMDFRFKRPHHRVKGNGELMIDVTKDFDAGPISYCESGFRLSMDHAIFRITLTNYSSRTGSERITQNLSEESLINALFTATAEMLVEDGI